MASEAGRADPPTGGARPLRARLIRGLRTLARSVGGVALAAHMLAIVLATLPVAGPHAQLRRLAQRHLGLDAYLDASGQRQSWAMFAPDPYRANVFVAVAVEAVDGTEHPLEHDVYAAIARQARVPYLRYDRRQKLNRAIAETAGTRRDYAAWVCRQWELDHGGAPARAVHFTLRRTFVPPPAVVDARPLAAVRIGFGATCLAWALAWVPERRLWFSDEGLYVPELARRIYGGPLRRAWDPQAGFPPLLAAPSDALALVWGRGSLLHLAAPPALVDGLLAGLIVALIGVVLGWRTRLCTAIAWWIALQLVRAAAPFATGADFVVPIGLFLGLITPWGRAWSLDARRRARAAQRRGGAAPAPTVPAWAPQLFMLQLACIYGATGALKTGDTWREGTALYYALNLDHFYRVPLMGPVAVAQWVGLLPLLTWLTRAWELGFPLALLGALLRGLERAGDDGVLARDAAWRRALAQIAGVVGWLALAWVLALAWAQASDPAASAPSAPSLTGWALVGGPPLVFAWAWLRGPAAVGASEPAAIGPRASGGLGRWRAWISQGLLGRGAWLGFGVALHLGIHVTMNVGLFAPLMLALYPAWWRGPALEPLAWPRLRLRRAWPRAAATPSSSPTTADPRATSSRPADPRT